SQHKDLGRLQLRPLQRVVEHILEPAVRRRLSNQDLLRIAKTLLESSHFSDPSTGSEWQFQALELAEKILSTNPDYKLNVLAVIRRKALSRLVRGEVFDDDNARLVQYLPPNAASRALLWDFQLSKAQDCVQSDDFSGAIRTLHQAVSSPPAKLSTLERRVHKRLRFQNVRYLYLAGEFNEAKAILKKELAALQHGEKVEDTLMALLVGVHCELQDPSEALRLAQSAVANQMGSQRMKILLAEAHLHVGIKHAYESMEGMAEASFSEARSICEEVMRWYESRPHFDQVAGKDEVAKVERIAYLRAVTVVARISALKAFYYNGNVGEARENWIKVFWAVSKCGWQKPGFMEGICYYTMATLDDSEASPRDMALAKTLLQESGFRNLIIGLGRVWFDILGTEVARRGGQWISIEQSQVKI
ncbi:hypothetical protein DL98DRAFT_190367, partial [Cadophora sp. DSE1049]